MWLSMPYSECPFSYNSMFSSRCPTWNSIYIRNWGDLYGVEKILLRLEHIEFKSNVVICALLRMPQQRKSCSSWSTQNSRQMWLSVPYSECPSPYSSMFFSRCSTWNSIYIRMPYSVQQYVLLGMPEMRLFGVRHLGQDMRLYRAIRSKGHSGYRHYREPGFV